ncbi:MAG: ABC transporter transmembrane domain-containing protein [Azospirillaceae bacterium]|nr:ABC transporter transmembrane domain-containing protein [Azospirillaceae bacterium]
MDKNIYKFILRYSGRQQIWLVFLTLVSFPALYYSLDLPKKIVNEAIHGGTFPKTMLSFHFDQLGYLAALSGLFLILVFINGGFKYYINLYKGQIGERMLRRIRYDLYLRIFRFPLPQFSRISSGEIIPMITAEIEPLGGFIGDALSQPIFQGGTLLVYIGFIFAQDPVLGAAAVSLYPVQGWLIPFLQRKVNNLGKRRVREMRRIADRISESVNGIQEIHGHDGTAWHLADIAHRFGDIYDIRFEIYRRKFFVKFLNNFINQLTPFFFYSIGGYLVIRGSLSFGALVAVLAAYKDLAGPWKELLDYYQQKEDIRIKYEQVVEQFQPPGLMPSAQILGDPAVVPQFTGVLSFRKVGYAEDGGPLVLNDITCDIPLDGHTAIVGGAGKAEMAQMLARQIVPTVGRITLDGQDLSQLPDSVVGRRMAFVGQMPYFFSSSLRQNLYYGLQHRPLRPALYDGAIETRMRRRLFEARQSGNSTDDPNAEWLDYAAAGCDDDAGLRRRVLELVTGVDLAEDAYAMGLHGTLNPQRQPEEIAKVLAARAAVREAQKDPRLGALFEQFDPDRYNTNASVAENLLFGIAVDSRLAPENLAGNSYVKQVFDKVGLTNDFIEMGRKVAETMIELFADLPPGHQFFEQFSFISLDEMPDFRAIVSKCAKVGVSGLARAERLRLVSLPFKLITARHRLDVLGPDMETRIIAARRVFAADLPARWRDAIAFFDVNAYNSAASIQDNILFGRIAYGHAHGAVKAATLISRVVDKVGLRSAIVDAGLDQPVGVSGSRLSTVQRQKAAIARALIKRPDLLVLSETTAALDGVAQTRIHQTILNERKGKGLVWVLHRPRLARTFDHILVLDNGHLIEQGSFEQLNRPGTKFHTLLQDE